MRLKKIKGLETFPFKPYTRQHKHGEPLKMGGTRPSKEIPNLETHHFQVSMLNFVGCTPPLLLVTPGFWAPSVNPLTQRLGDGIIAW